MAKIVLELTVTNGHFRIRPIFMLPGVLARDERVLDTCSSPNLKPENDETHIY